MKGKDLEDALLEQGMKRGVLFFKELDETFPSEYFPLSEMENFLRALEQSGVRVIDHEKSQMARPRRRGMAA
jgi:hypothetical protein